jgi:hypothetical protein
MDNWKVMYNEGQKYLSTASKTAGSKVFTPSLRYNITAMALEKYVMATCMLHDYLPQNHTLTDLMDAVARFVPSDPSLQRTILQYEDAQRLCSLEDYHREDLSPEDLEKFVMSVVSFCNVIDIHCKELEL